MLDFLRISEGVAMATVILAPAPPPPPPPLLLQYNAIHFPGGLPPLGVSYSTFHKMEVHSGATLFQYVSLLNFYAILINALGGASLLLQYTLPINFLIYIDEIPFLISPRLASQNR